MYRKNHAGIYDDLNTNCADSSNGIVFLPYLSGTYFSDIDCAMGSFIGLDTSSNIYQMYRAVLEGLSCETQELFQALEQYGFSVNRVTASGGASKSSVYMQIKAEITGRRICTLENSEAGICGLAMLCAVEMGCYRDLSEAAKKFVRIKDSFNPGKRSEGIVERYHILSSAVRTAYQNPDIRRTF